MRRLPARSTERLSLRFAILAIDRRRARRGSPASIGSCARDGRSVASGKSRSKSRMFREVGAAPLVDRLVGVADDAEVAVRRREPLDQQVLRPVGVLILVHHHVAELLGGYLRADRARTCSTELHRV